MSDADNVTTRNGSRCDPAMIGAIMLLGAAFLTVLFFRIKHIQMPLERDEGEFAYCGRLLLDGHAPFLNAYVMKLPGIHYAYAAIMFVFGETVQGIRTGHLLVNIMTAGGVGVLCERHWGRAAGFSAAAVFLVLSLGNGVLGLFAHATNFVNLFLVIGLLLLSIAYNHRTIWLTLLAGISCGAAITMKQHAVFVSLYAMLVVLVAFGPSLRERLLSTGSMLAGMLVPPGLTLLVVTIAGTFRTFKFWVVDYARAYVSEKTIADGWRVFKLMFGDAVEATWPLWVAGVAGIIVAALLPSSRKRGGLLSGYFIASSLAVIPGFHFRPHYFVMLLPAISVGFGVLAEIIQSRGTGTVSRYLGVVPALIGVAGLIFMVSSERAVLFSSAPETAVKLSYVTVKPFAEAPAVGRFLASRTKEGEKVLVLGSEPEILFYSGRQSVTGHIYMYPLVEQQPFQQRMRMEFLREAFSQPPNYVVFVKDMSSWLLPNMSAANFYEHLQKLVEEKYDLVGRVDIYRDKPSVYYWVDEDARRMTAGGNSQILIYAVKI